MLVIAAYQFELIQQFPFRRRADKAIVRSTGEARSVGPASGDHYWR
jgi:hypothetical protein